MKPLAETHGVNFELVRHFLARMFESEMFSMSGQWQRVAVSAVATILPAGIVFSSSWEKYRLLSELRSPEPFRSAAVADELAVLVLMVAASGLLALIQWQSLFPGKRDYVMLAGLPVRSRQIFASRFAAVALFTTGFVVAANALPSLLMPLQIAGRWQKNPSFVVNAAAHGISASLACYFIFLAVMALHGVLLNALPAKWFARVSTYAQGLGIAVCFFAALFSWSIADWTPGMVAKLPLGQWAPPVWFLGLHEFLLGDRDPFFAAMARRALLSTGAALGITVLTYLAGYRCYRKLLVEVPPETSAPRRREWSILRGLAGDPRREPIMQFMARTLARSRTHRTVLLAYVGAGIGLVLNSALLTRAASRLAENWYEAVQFAVLFWPLALSAVVLPGFRHVCSLPAELPANWIFQTTESLGRKQWMSALERFTIVCVIGPIYLVVTPIAVSVLGWGLALRMSVLQVLVSLTMFEVLFYTWQQLPFACSYIPGKRPLMAMLARAIALLGILVPVLTIFVRTASMMTETFLVFLPVFVFIWLWTRRRRREGWGEAKLLFEDRLEVVPNLGLGELTYRADAPPDVPAEPGIAPTHASAGAG